MTDYPKNNGNIGYSYTEHSTTFDQSVNNRGWWNWVRFYKDGSEIWSKKLNATEATHTLTVSSEGTTYCTLYLKREFSSGTVNDYHHYCTVSTSSSIPKGTYRVDYDIADSSDGSWGRHQDTIKGTFSISSSYYVRYCIEDRYVINNVNVAPYISIRATNYRESSDNSPSIPSSDKISFEYTEGNTDLSKSPHYYIKWGANEKYWDKNYGSLKETTDGGTYEVYARIGDAYSIESKYRYIVKFDVNTNSGSGTVPSEQTFTQTTSTYSFTLPELSYTRGDYSFGGWAKTSDATSGTTGSLKLNYGTTTLYAVWVFQGYTREISFDLNGGQGDIPEEYSVWSSSPNALSSLPQLDTFPTREGYVFSGWDTQPNAPIGAMETIYLPPGNIILYACWRPEPQVGFKGPSGWIRGDSVYVFKDGEWKDASELYVRKNGNWVRWNQQ